MANTPITVARGDGIGPEIMDATLRILEGAGARLDIEEIEIGERVYLAGNPAGVAPEAFASLRRTRVFLKAPITTPQGGGYKSLNVTVRKTFGLYANVRPCVSYHPFVETKHPVMDVVIVRENEEDVYGGIEYRQTGQVTQCLKLISRPGTEKIVRYAFEYARRNNRRKVTCFTKDNIMKITDGLFHKIFEEIAPEYPDIENEHWIVDIGAAKLADAPENFDVLVLPNLYGDVLSDVAAQIAGSVGLAGSANIGEHIAMFEAIHGSAPRRAGQNLANPSGLFLGAVMMLVHIGQTDVAERAHNAWLRTMEDGVHTYDIYKEGVSKEKVGTREFAAAVVARLGQKPETLKAVSYKSDGKGASSASHAAGKAAASNKETVGVDVYLDWTGGSADELGAQVSKLSGDGLRLSSIANRGVKVYPDGNAETFCSDHWRCRFSAGGSPVKHAQVAALLAR
ncbi:MAG: isocitrate dehydrogenase, partial [Acidobacteriota bacterium]|nr:isocitrate dehydrogenase [Acidobacteriota bacterium]